MAIIPERIQLARGTAAAWTAANPVLLAGEVGWESDTGYLKFGDGVTAWTSLLYNQLPTATLVQWAKMPDSIITGAITRNANEVITSAAVVWPDGTAGTFTTDTIGTLNTIDAYHITYGSPTVIHTFTQSAITRDSTGAATTVPAIVVT
jgi:hypothetical protein